MSLKNVIVAALCGSTLVSSLAFGQESLVSRADIRIERPVPLLKSRSEEVAQPNSSASGAFLCTYLCFFSNLSNTQTYNPYQRTVELKNDPDHVCATYVFRFSVKRWSPITPVNALVLDPRKAVARAADFDFERPSLSRTGHRGSFYNSATLNKGGLGDLYRFSNSEVPAAVFGYSF